jgi:hypothetical protein
VSYSYPEELVLSRRMHAGPLIPECVEAVSFIAVRVMVAPTTATPKPIASGVTRAHQPSVYRLPLISRSVAGRLVERDPDAPILGPDDSARIDFLVRYNDQCKPIRDDANLRPDVECGPRLRQIANNTAYRHVAEPDQTGV